MDGGTYAASHLIAAGNRRTGEVMKKLSSKRAKELPVLSEEHDVAVHRGYYQFALVIKDGDGNVKEKRDGGFVTSPNGSLFCGVCSCGGCGLGWTHADAEKNVTHKQATDAR